MNKPYYVQSELVRGERRQYWVEDRRIPVRVGPGHSNNRIASKYTSNKRTAEKQCDQLNALAEQAEHEHNNVYPGPM